MKERHERVCDATSNEHADANLLVEHLIAHNGTVAAPQDEIAAKLDMWRNHGGGVRTIDRGRYHRARNHIRDRVDAEGRPCCGFTLHYRRSGHESVLALVDPSGDLGEHAAAAVATIRGWVSRERQHHTENQRMIETLDLLGDHVLANSDRKGYRLLQRAAIDIDRDGTISPETMRELEMWLVAL